MDKRTRNARIMAYLIIGMFVTMGLIGVLSQLGAP